MHIHASPKNKVFLGLPRHCVIVFMARKTRTPRSPTPNVVKIFKIFQDCQDFQDFQDFQGSIQALSLPTIIDSSIPIRLRVGVRFRVRVTSVDVRHHGLINSESLCNHGPKVRVKVRVRVRVLGARLG